MTVLQHIDYDALNALKEVMEDDFGFLIETFIQDSHDRLAKLQSLVGSADADAIRRAAHSFKGSCSNMGTLRLASLCAAVESRAVEGSLTDLSLYTVDIEEEFLLIKQMLLDFMV